MSLIVARFQDGEWYAYDTVAVSSNDRLDPEGLGQLLEGLMPHYARANPEQWKGQKIRIRHEVTGASFSGTWNGERLIPISE